MKRNIYIIISLLLTGTALTSCFKEPVLTPAVPTRNLSVSLVRNLYKGTNIALNEQNVGVTPLAGTIISDAASGNIAQGKFVIVQTKDSVTAGITVAVKNLQAINFVPGDSIVFDIRGATLSRDNGSLEIQDVNAATIFKVRSRCAVEPVSLTLTQLSANFDTYESMLVQITAADLIPIDGGNNYNGSKKLDDGSVATDINLYTFPTASFASENIPGNADFLGIPTYAGNVKQLRIRNTGDVSNTSIPHHSAILITGFMSDPTGTDIPVTTGYLGGFEYVQLMATEDINFAATPYSVVFSRNAPSSTSPENGWATGGTRTFKLNLTSGTAAKGTFFYVGGPEKRIAGSVSADEKSTDISETAPISANRANWIRTKVMGNGSNSATVLLGDDFGGSSTDWLYNQSSYLAGIAVFKGTSVTNTTVPIDAIFYGDSGYASFRLFDATASTGYLVPNNDWYNAIVNNEPQAYYKQGSNTYLYGGVQPSANVSNWAFLGGVYSLNAHAWIAQRSISYTALLPSGKPVNTPQLADIETGIKVTKLRE